MEKTGAVDLAQKKISLSHLMLRSGKSPKLYKRLKKILEGYREKLQNSKNMAKFEVFM